jgi:hypothetical protein
MLCGYFPFWGASLLICFADAEPVLFVPQIEPRDHIPAGLRVQEYPWGDLKCSDPYSVLVSAVANELVKAGIAAERVGMNPSTSRTSLPIQAGEQIPFPEGFSGQLSALTTKVDAQHQKAYSDLYLRKTAEEVDAIRRANRVAAGNYRGGTCGGGRIGHLSANWPRRHIPFSRVGHGSIRIEQRRRGAI